MIKLNCVQKKSAYELIEIPVLPLLEKAKDWGTSVKAILGNFRYHGYYFTQKSKIVLATQKECVFP